MIQNALIGAAINVCMEDEIPINPELHNGVAIDTCAVL